MDAIFRQAWKQPMDPKLKEMFRRVPAVPSSANVAYRLLREAEAPMTATPASASAPAPAPATRPPAQQPDKGHSSAQVSNSARVTKNPAPGGNTRGPNTPAAAVAKPVPTPAAGANAAKGAPKTEKKGAKTEKKGAKTGEKGVKTEKKDKKP